MASAKSSDINLLPHDLDGGKKGPQRITKKRPAFEYTGANGKEEKQKNSEKKPSFVSRLFSIFKRTRKVETSKNTIQQKQVEQKKEATNTDLPPGKPLPSALFANSQKSTPKEHSQKSEEITKPVPPGVSADTVMSMHTPTVAQKSELTAPATPPKPAIAQPISKVTSSPISGKAIPKPAVKASHASTPVPAKTQQKKGSLWKRFTSLFKKKDAKPQVPSVQASIQAQSKPEQKPSPKPVAKPQPVAQPKPTPTTPRPQPIVSQKPESGSAKVVARAAAGGETNAPVHRVSGFDVNLLSAEYTESFNKGNPLLFLGLWTGATVLMIGIMFGLLHLYESSVAAELAKEEQVTQALKQTITTYNSLSEQDLVLRGKVAAAGELLSSHISWHSFLGELEAVTIPEITYISTAASTEGSIGISAFASDYTGLARQIAVYQQTPWIEDITITSAARIEESAITPEGVSFDMTLEISPDILYLDSAYE